MQPALEIETETQDDMDMQDEGTSPIPNPVFPPTSQLRRAFFSDLDASSRVNPNRHRAPSATPYTQGDMNTVRTIIVGALREESPAATAAAMHSDVPAALHVASIRRSVNPREDFGEEVLDVYEELHKSKQPRGGEGHDHVHAVSAVITNVVAGSLAGVALRRASSAMLANVGAGVLVTQLLCFTGHATMDWKRLFRDMWTLVFKGVPPKSPEQAQRRVRRLAVRMLNTLTATIPRRLSFWLGAAGGFILL